MSSTAMRIARAVNPYMVKLAGGRRLAMQARLTHRGRKSGRTYTIPVNARLTEHGFLVPMPYGETVDWCRNIMVAGECQIRYHGVDYVAGDPEIVSADDLRSTIRTDFNPFERLFIKMVKLRMFLLLPTVRRA
ncbi:nitroreductase [Fodinicola acaciae]|uniref:nitroreductase n=1 Tax=Fodinicola acaciae TaxID=2681555 RepID=UPI0013D30BDA|nr:nitroreductase [Fodinicola acaciae]